MIWLALITPEDYYDYIKGVKANVYVDGDKVTDLMSHPVTKSAVDATAKVYELAQDSRYEDVMTATSHLTGEKINRNLHVNRDNLDLEKRAEMALLTSQKLGTCNYRCVGCDVINAVASVTYEIDRNKGTNYQERFNEFLKKAQAEDWAISGAVTDAKGDRKKRISEEDPDMHVHISNQDDDGIYVRGAKLHQSGAICSHYTIVIPGSALREGEEKFAVAFAVENNAPGLTYISQYNAYSVEREHCDDINELGNPRYGQRETCMMIFEDVFIPWKNVFMCGEREYGASNIMRFAKTHRMNCGGACKVGYADIIIGASALAAELSGTEKANHIREMLTEMARLSESARAATIAAYYKGIEEPEGSGVYMPDDVFGNVAKITTAENFWQIISMAGDIAGGLVVTAPSMKELKNPETKPYIEKFLRAAGPADKRMKINKVLQNWVAGLHGAGTWHGAGSPQAQKMSLGRVIDWEEKKNIAKEIAELED